MMFFQVTLVLGYAYAHLIRRYLTCRSAFIVHATLVVAACFFLPVVPEVSLRPVNSDGLTSAVTFTLLLTVGLPYFVLAANSTLVQIWYEALTAPDLSDRSDPSTASTYRLYAVSNLGSMSALLCYPFFIAPKATLPAQGWIWSAGFLCYAMLCLYTALPTVKLSVWLSPSEVSDGGKVGRHKILLWFSFSAVASTILLATTNLMCQEIASAPFLWILPLAVYLLSFIVCFERPQVYHRAVFIPLMCLSVILGIGVVQAHIYVSILLQITAMTGVCFFVSMTCHGELERLKPAAARLTSFYLAMAVGGAAGGIFSAILAPIIFDSFLEFQVAILGCLLLVVIQVWATTTRGIRSFTTIGCGLVAAVTIASLMLQATLELEKDAVITRQRNEYGVVMVTQDDRYRRFVSGNVDHGRQHLSAEKAFEPSGYYTVNSGVGIAFERMREFKQSQNNSKKINAGVVGMGIGAMLAWCEPGDHFSFYEINPLVKDIAEEHFTFLRKYESQIKVFIGDGRMLMEQQLKQRSKTVKFQLFDLIFVDAFSSDAIPQHLLTSQCVDLYLQHLAEDGMVIFHITNRFVDLRPVIAQVAVEKGLFTFVRENKNSIEDRGTLWVCLSRNEDLLSAPWMDTLESPWPSDMPTIRWTDDFAPLAPVTIWNTKVDVDALQASQARHEPNGNHSDEHYSAEPIKAADE